MIEVVRCPQGNLVKCTVENIRIDEVDQSLFKMFWDSIFHNTPRHMENGLEIIGTIAYKYLGDYGFLKEIEQWKMLRRDHIQIYS